VDGVRSGEPDGRARPDRRGETQQPLHLSTLAREQVDHLRRAQAAGLRGNSGRRRHTPGLTDEAIRGLDRNMKMNPPLDRGRSRMRWSRRCATAHAAIANDQETHSRGEDVTFEARTVRA